MALILVPFVIQNLIFFQLMEANKAKKSENNNGIISDANLKKYKNDRKFTFFNR